MAESIYFCTTCQEEDTSNPAVTWCLECEEWLCTDCNRHHGRSKLSKHHKTVSVQDYKLLPPEVLQIKNKCHVHQVKYERFCSQHGTLCCIQCISDKHKECLLSPLNDALSNIKSSVSLSNLEEDLQTIKENFEIIETCLSQKTQNFNRQKNECFDKIHQCRKLLNDQLDALERNIKDDVLDKHTMAQAETEKLITQVRARKLKMSALQGNIPKIKQFASDSQMFMIIKNIEKEASETNKFQQDLHNGDALCEGKLEFRLSDILESFQKDANYFGQVVLHSVPFFGKLRTSRQDQAQLMVSSAITLGRIKVVKMYHMDIPKRRIGYQITGGVIMKNRKCLLCDYNNDRLILFNSNGVYEPGLERLPFEPQYLAYIENNVVAVRCNNKDLVFLDVTSNKILKRIHESGDGLSKVINSDNKHIIIKQEDYVTIIELESMSRRRVKIQTDVKFSDTLSLFNNKIYYFSTEVKTVACCDMNGRLLWSHQNEILDLASRINVGGKSGFVYVTCETSNKLLAISPNGEESRILLDSKDGLDKPYVVHVSNEHDLLLVCNRNGRACLFQIQYV